jgi:hypothetical protein
MVLSCPSAADMSNVFGTTNCNKNHIESQYIYNHESRNIYSIMIISYREVPENSQPYSARAFGHEQTCARDAYILTEVCRYLHGFVHVIEMGQQYFLVDILCQIMSI